LDREIIVHQIKPIMNFVFNKCKSLFDTECMNELILQINTPTAKISITDIKIMDEICRITSSEPISPQEILDTKISFRERENAQLFSKESNKDPASRFEKIKIIAEKVEKLKKSRH